MFPRKVNSVMAMVVFFSSASYAGIDSWNLTITVDTHACHVAAFATATGGPGLHMFIDGGSGLPDSPLVGNDWPWATTESTSTERFWAGGFHHPSAEIIIETVFDHFSHYEFVTFTCDSLPGGNSGDECDPALVGGDNPFPIPDLDDPADTCISPILIDLNQDGFQFGERGTGVNFDILGTGIPMSMQWVKPFGDEAFLVRDKNDNGIVDDGSELFGNGTRLELQNDKLAPNGFVGLAQFDDLALGGNNDGYITEKDEVWDSLFLWLDFDANSISTPDEMGHIEDFGLTQLETIPKETRHYDDAGNWLRFFANAKNNQGHIHEMVDVFFRVLDNGSKTN